MSQRSRRLMLAFRQSTSARITGKSTQMISTAYSKEGDSLENASKPMIQPHICHLLGPHHTHSCLSNSWLYFPSGFKSYTSTSHWSKLPQNPLRRESEKHCSQESKLQDHEGEWRVIVAGCYNPCTWMLLSWQKKQRVCGMPGEVKGFLWQSTAQNSSQTSYRKPGCQLSSHVTSYSWADKENEWSERRWSFSQVTVIISHIVKLWTQKCFKILSTTQWLHFWVTLWSLIKCISCSFSNTMLPGFIILHPSKLHPYSG